MSEFRNAWIIIMLALVFVGAQIQEPTHVTERMVLTSESCLNIQSFTNVNTVQCSYACFYNYDTVSLTVIGAEGDLKFSKTQIKLKVNEFDCGGDLKTRDFKSLLKSKKHPEILIELKDFVHNQNDKVHGTMHSLITITDVQRAVDISVNAHQVNDKEIRLKGKTEIQLKDFNIEAPTLFMGLIVVEERVAIDFDFRFHLL